MVKLVKHHQWKQTGDKHPEEENDNSAKFSSVQFRSAAQLCPTLCDPMNHSTPGLPVYH